MFTTTFPQTHGLSELVDAWRSAAHDAHRAWETWKTSASRDRGAAFDSYRCSLDREERAAAKLAAAVERVSAAQLPVAA